MREIAAELELALDCHALLFEHLSKYLGQDDRFGKVFRADADLTICNRPNI